MFVWCGCQVLSGLSKLQLLQLDKFDAPDFRLVTTAPFLCQLSSFWTCLTVLNLFNMDESELPSDAIGELWRFSSLRSLSINSHMQPPVMQRLAWWQLPPKLVSLNLSWFDLCSEILIHAWPRFRIIIRQGKMARCVLAVLMLVSCCLSSADADACVVPRFLQGRMTYHHTICAHIMSYSCRCSCNEHLGCLAACRLARHFSNLYFLHLHNCILPRDFLRMCLPAMVDQLDSLSLWRVQGTEQDDMHRLSCVTGLSALQLWPLDHDLQGLSMLQALKQLKRLKLRWGMTSLLMC